MKKNKPPQSLPVKNTPGYDTYHQIQSRTQPTPQISTNSAIVELNRELKQQEHRLDSLADEGRHYYDLYKKEGKEIDFWQRKAWKTDLAWLILAVFCFGWIIALYV